MALDVEEVARAQVTVAQAVAGVDRACLDDECTAGLGAVDDELAGERAEAAGGLDQARERPRDEPCVRVCGSTCQRPARTRFSNFDSGVVLGMRSPYQGC